jgi:hypothetical protein
VSYAATNPDSFDRGRVELVRLDPGAAEPQPLLTAPAGTEEMNVATDYVDTFRPAGPPANGLNVREVFGRAATVALCLSPFVLPVLGLLGWLLWRRRRSARYG